MDDQTNQAQPVPVDHSDDMASGNDVAPANDAIVDDQVPADEPVDEEDQTVEAVRRQAVDALLPIVDSVEGTPEYKFEMLMNALESVPNTVLLQKAMDAANQIEDPSVKAQALVDLLNLTNSI